jgi:hypothetical protein
VNTIVVRCRSLMFCAAIVALAAPRTYSQSGGEEKPAPAAKGELKNVAVIAAAPYQKVVGDIAFLGSLAGKPELGQMVDGGLAFFTQGKAATALDKTKPWGVIVQTDGANFIPVACLPVIKGDDLLGVAKNYGAQVKDGENGAKEITLPNKRSVFVKQENGLAFVTTSAASLSKLPANPQELLTKMAGEYDLTVHASIKNIPEMYRQFALQAMQAGMQQGMKKNESESDEQYAQRQKMTQGQMDQMSRMINEIDSLTFGWAVDSQQQRTFMDFTYTFVAGSKMAKQISSYGAPKTDFAGFYQPDGAATMTFATKGDPQLMAEDMAQFEASMDSARQQLNQAIDKKVDDTETRDALKAAAADAFDAAAATIKLGQMDGGASLHLSPDSLTFVAGAHVADTAKVESALKKLEGAAKKSPDFPGIKWNAANHGGAAFHTLTIPVPEGEAGPRKLLGSQLDVAVGIASDAVYVGVGKDNIEAVSKAIDASAKDKGKSVPPFEFAVSLTPIMEVAASQAENSEQKEVIQKVADFLKNDAQGRDHVRAVGTMLPNGIKYHLEAEEGVLKAIGTAAAAVQQQKMQAAHQ